MMGKGLRQKDYREGSPDMVLNYPDLIQREDFTYICMVVIGILDELKKPNYEVEELWKQFSRLEISGVTVNSFGE